MSQQSLLSLDFKKTERTSFTPALKNYIQTSYGEDPDTYIDDFRTLEEQRNDIIFLEPHQSSVERLRK